MKKHFNRKILWSFLLASSIFLNAQESKQSKDSGSLKYPFKHWQSGGLFLSNPSVKEITYDVESGNYVMEEKIGNYIVRFPVYMTREDFRDYTVNQGMKTFFDTKLSLQNSSQVKQMDEEVKKNLLPNQYVNSNFFKSLFGGNEIKTNIQGSLFLKMGLLYQEIDNPQLSEENRKSSTFNFDQDINVNFSATLGTRVKAGIQYDTKATFDFQNLIKMEFIPPDRRELLDLGKQTLNEDERFRKGKELFNRGQEIYQKGEDALEKGKEVVDKAKSYLKKGEDYLQRGEAIYKKGEALYDKGNRFLEEGGTLMSGGEDDIVQNLEFGNISMPVKNSLILGAQSLFGVKSKLKFGHTTITAAFAEQKSQTKSVATKGGSTIKEFELLASDYDENKHFFISHYFRDNYNKSLENYPLINSPINITRVEVWVTNRNATTKDMRNIVAVADLGEGELKNLGPTDVIPTNVDVYPSNNANNLSSLLEYEHPIREIATVNQGLAPYNMQQGRDFSVLENARKLKLEEFRFHPQLGYISLNQKLSDSDVLAVAFEYTVNGKSEVYRVGELASDGIIAPDNIVVKLVRGEVPNFSNPIWNLMMKNVYSLGSYRMEPEEFRLEVLYSDSEVGVPINILQNASTTEAREKTLLNIMALDRLDQTQNEIEGGDGYFDYIKGVTVNSERGLIIFPTIEPFGSDLAQELTHPDDEKYIFEAIYKSSKSEAKNGFQQKDKYLIKGYYTSQEANGIPIGAFNIPKGSVRVTTGGRELVEGVDYVVDYLGGRVQIVNPSLQSSNIPIEVSVENNSAFNLQTKRFIGVDVQHQFSKNFVAGATFLNLKDNPITKKASYGYEPINNTMIGFNTTFTKEVPFLTKLVNKLPNIETEEKSNFSIRGDFAYLLPGSPDKIKQNGEDVSYIDDFESVQTPLEMKSILQWNLASTPQHQSNFNGNATDLSYGDKRAKISWYIIDPLFYGGSSLKPSNVDQDELSRAEVRAVNYSELFPKQDLDLTEISIVRTMDIAYFPHEKGSYNYTDQGLDANGKFINPEEKWGGITRALNTTDFEKANVEYIQFWLMDPYQHYSIRPDEGRPEGVDASDPNNQVGEMYINLGNISEDVLKDGRKQYENGLPESELEKDKFESTIWGKVPSKQSLLYAFSNSDTERTYQDVGLDGLNDEEEIALFGSQFGDDPSNDNYQFYRGTQYDNEGASILNRYKHYNNTQGNSTTTNTSTESYPTSSTVYPDTEDLNKDQTMNSVESYYQYRVSLDPYNLEVGKNHIIDEKMVSVQLANGDTEDYRWLQFRIPVNRPSGTYNNISGFNSIRFMRVFLTKFKMPIVLRFGEFQLVRGDWRRYTKTLNETIQPPSDLDQFELNNFESGVVNIEENENRIPIPYVLPPGIERELLRGTSTVQEQNEQSVTLKVRNLDSGKTRAIFKNVKIDLRVYKNLKMFIHAEKPRGEGIVEDDDFRAIIRIGSDLTENYYQIEKPIEISSTTAFTPIEVWPSENNLNLVLSKLGKLKIEKYKNKIPVNELYPNENQDPIEIDGYIVRVKGNPSLSDIRTLMLGVKNVSDTPKNIEVWFNEFRASEFENEGGWAAVVNVDSNLADFADVSVTGRVETSGFGNISETVNERNQEETKLYDFVTNVQLGELFPDSWGLRVPLSYSISEEVSSPKYDNKFGDVFYEDAQEVNSNSQFSKDYTKRKSLSFMNIGKDNTGEKNRFYSIENFTGSYAYNELYHRDYKILKQVEQDLRMSIGYVHSFKTKPLEPFKKIKFLKSKHFNFIKDFNINLFPSSIAANTNINRRYTELNSRSLVEELPNLPTLKQRNYLFDWSYTVGYNLTKSIQLNFDATNNYIYDTFEKEDESTIHQNLLTFGRPLNYRQALRGTYKLPINKLPFLNFVDANYTYTANYDWKAPSNANIEKIGNLIQNANTHTMDATLNFNRFYKTIKLEKLFLENKKGKSKKGKGKKYVMGFFGKSLYTLLSAFKDVKVNYTENNGTMLPGFVPEAGFIGRDNYNGGMAPTLGFVFGSQVDILQKAVENGWIISRNENDPYYSKNYTKTHLDKFDLKIKAEPFPDLLVDFSGSKTYTDNLNRQIDVISGELNNEAPISRYGNFTMSFNMIRTAFNDKDKLFETFKNNREVIANRLASTYNQSVSGFGSTSQQVALPAFLAAYTGTDPSNVSLEPFRKIPIPDWKATYRGLMKFDWFKKHFSNFSISHAYRSLYSITNYTNNLSYDSASPFKNKDIAGNYLSEILFTNIDLVEEFSPLVQVDMKMKNSFSLSGKINKDRALTLNFNNNTITQSEGIEYTVGTGYRIKDVELRLRFGGKKRRIKGDINIKADFSLRDNITLIRAIDDDNDQITGGQRILSLKVKADYNLGKSFTASLYFDQDASSHAISTTFPRKSISSGISIRYILGN